MVVKILAVSGGVDSVVMLDLIAKSGEDKREILVAHFNHGIRDDSDEDEVFVEGLAEKYGVKFEHKKEYLGEGASEELARERRYLFLQEVALRYGGVICTAHHADDVVETIAINLIRGTGWRGLVPLDNIEILRPMLKRKKEDNIKYAHDNGLIWREDKTNSDDKYLRNRVRKSLRQIPEDDKERLIELYAKQKELKHEIDDLARDFLVDDGIYERRLFCEMDEAVASEVLRAVLIGVGKTTTMPQRRLLFNAIKTFKSGKKLNLLKDFMVVFSRDKFWFDVIK
jgi:tRNA(Ile)-lysidine synthetase, N-terminal domain